MELQDAGNHHNDGFEEETVYVLVELPDAVPALEPGTTLRLAGMDTAEPTLEWEGGPLLLGEYEETVGTQLLFRDEVQPNGSHSVALQSHTTNKLRFRVPPPPPEEAGKDAKAAAAGAGKQPPPEEQQQQQQHPEAAGGQDGQQQDGQQQEQHQQQQQQQQQQKEQASGGGEEQGGGSDAMQI